MTGFLTAFDKAQLEAWRKRVDSDGNRIAGMLDRLVADGYRLDEPELKRIPPPYDKDHPHGALLRRKGCALWADVSGRGSPLDRVMAAFKELMPVYELLRQM